MSEFLWRWTQTPPIVGDPAAFVAALLEVARSRLARFAAEIIAEALGHSRRAI